jgi:hypothetical protein
VVQVDPEYPLPSFLSQLFGSKEKQEVTAALEATACSWSELKSWQSRWPTAEILQFDAYPLNKPLEDLLSTANPGREGTLGWLSRLTTNWQTRLVVLNNLRANEANARRLAQALVARGGPAVLVGSYLWHLPLETFYERLVHDRPLDVAWWDAEQERWPWRYGSLFVGAGREEALRVSNVGQALANLPFNLLSGNAADLTEWFGRSVGDPGIALFRLQNELTEFTKDWSELKFNLHESEGFLPVASRLASVRRIAGITEGRRKPVESAPGPRWVNAHLSQDFGNGNIGFLPQSSARLELGRTYHLGVQVGPKDLRVRSLDNVALLEEVFQWTDDMKGVWLEIGVTGLDFDVLGDPVQELWMPREGPSDPLYFAIVPRISGVSRIRFCVYFRQEVLQSFRLAAYTGGPPPKRTVRRRAYLLAEQAGFHRGWEMSSGTRRRASFAPSGTNRFATKPIGWHRISVFRRNVSTSSGTRRSVGFGSQVLSMFRSTRWATRAT